VEEGKKTPEFLGGREAQKGKKSGLEKRIDKFLRIRLVIMFLHERRKTEKEKSNACSSTSGQKKITCFVILFVGEKFRGDGGITISFCPAGQLCHILRGKRDDFKRNATLGVLSRRKRGGGIKLQLRGKLLLIGEEEKG